MNLSMKWLADYVKLPSMSLRDFSEAMTMSGSKVEGWETECEDVKNVVVAKVLSMERHPDSDHLWVCQLDCGKGEPVQIVTGAQNVVEGAYVPAALHKSLLPNGTKITKGKLRGVMSNGMMCSLSELKLTLGDFPYAEEDGIFLIEEEGIEPGMPIQDAIGYNDTSVEFEITPNRPDCLSVVGLAREAAATFHIPLALPDESVKGVGDDVNNYLSVSVENKELCKRYAARIVKNVKVGPSPRWIRERLRASGVRPINNIVDITNYVMLEYGQPMHAFDLNYVKDGKIIVRNAKEGESITTLEGVEHKLSPEMLVIADAEKPSAVAGVMGGEYSGINDGTTTIVFESANFHGPSVRTTSRKLGLRTESSGRFEKGLDAQNCIPAINRACHLMEQLGIGEVVDGIIDVDNSGYQPLTLDLDCAWINHFLGTELSEEQMKGYLAEAGFGVEGSKVAVPSFRMDVEHKADLAEEVARFYGYNKIPTTISRSNSQGGYSPFQKFERQIHDCMLAQGLYEVMTYSFISPKYYDKINLPADSAQRNSVTILNPLGEDTSIMRTNAIPSMLEVLARNYNNRNASAALYEIGSEYIPVEGEDLPNEIPHVIMGMYGDEQDFFTLKGVVENLLETLNIRDYDVDAVKDDPTFHPGRCAAVSLNGEALGIFGQIHPAVCGNYGVKKPMYVAKLNMNALFAAEGEEKKYHALPKFPASTRDLALLCDDALPVLKLEKAIKAACGKICENVALFDVYKGAQIEAGKKSVAFNITMRAADRTLTDEEVGAAMEKVVAAVTELGCIVR